MYITRNPINKAKKQMANWGIDFLLLLQTKGCKEIEQHLSESKNKAFEQRVLQRIFHTEHWESSKVGNTLFW